MQQVEVHAWRMAESRTDALRRFFVGGTEELADLRALHIPDRFDLSRPQCLNKHGLQTVTTGSIQLRVHTLIQQHQAPVTPAASRLSTGGASRKPEVRKPPADLGAMRGIVGVNTLARSETAKDRVQRRLDERRRAEAQRAE